MRQLKTFNLDLVTKTYIADYKKTPDIKLGVIVKLLIIFILNNLLT